MPIVTCTCDCCRVSYKSNEGIEVICTISDYKYSFWRRLFPSLNKQYHHSFTFCKKCFGGLFRVGASVELDTMGCISQCTDFNGESIARIQTEYLGNQKD